MLGIQTRVSELTSQQETKIIIIFNPKLGHISITDNFEGIYYMMTKNTIGNDAMRIWTILEYWLFNLYMINSIILFVSSYYIQC